MRIEFLSRNYNMGDKLRAIIEKKVMKLDKFFDEDTKAKIVLKQTKEIESLEITIGLNGGVIRAEVSSDNMYDNIDLAIPKIEKQIIKHHSKIKSKKAKIKDIDFSDLNEDKPVPKPQVVKSKTFELVPMTVEDAIDELELVGHNFYVFLNKSTGNVSIVYQRNDGDFGVIETTT